MHPTIFTESRPGVLSIAGEGTLGEPPAPPAGRIRGTITHSIGVPLDLEACRGKRSTSASLLREVTDLTMGKVTTLLAEIRQERPPAKETEITDKTNSAQQTDGG